MAFWRPVPFIGIDAVWTGSHARYVDSPDGNHVAGAVENAGEFGISFVQPKWEASLRVRHLGEYPLIEDNSQRADPETTFNVRGAWKPGLFTLYAELLNVFDENGKDIVYWYSTHVAGLDPAGEQIDGRVSRAEEPRTVRVGVKYHF